MSEHKRYLAFYINYYYPSGGMDDLEKSFDTKEELIEWLNKNKQPLGDSDWGVHGFDCQERVIIKL